MKSNTFLALIEDYDKTPEFPLKVRVIDIDDGKGLACFRITDPDDGKTLRTVLRTFEHHKGTLRTGTVIVRICEEHRGHTAGQLCTIPAVVDYGAIPFLSQFLNLS